MTSKRATAQEGPIETGGLAATGLRAVFSCIACAAAFTPPTPPFASVRTGEIGNSRSGTWVTISGLIGLPCAILKRDCSAEATFPLWLASSASARQEGFPPAFTIASPRSTEGEAMVKAGGRVTVHAQQSSAEESRVGAPTSPPRRGFPTPPAWPQCSWDADKRDLKAGFFSLRSNSAISCTPKKIFNTPSVIVGRTATRSPRNALPNGNALPL